MKKIIKKAVISFFKIFPLKNNKIFFCNFTGKGYGDNPKYIAEELAARNLDYQLIWMTSDMNNTFPEYIRPVKAWSLKHYYELATSKGIVSNVRVNLGVEKRPRQIYLQTWHAPFSAKCVEKDAENLLLPEYVEDAKHDGIITDGILVSSSLQEKQFKRAFWLNDKVEYLKFGLPRNDVLIKNKNNKKMISDTRKIFNIKENEYVVLYAPTFRDDYSTDGYKLDFEKIRQAFCKKTGKNCKIIIRLHPNVQKQADFIEYTDNLLNGSLVPDVQELSIMADIVISDYSTALFDFSILGKPALMCAVDLERYRQIRGLLPEFDEFPFPLAHSSEELVEIIHNFDIDLYNENVKRYFEKNRIYDEGDASQKAVDWILNKLNNS